MRGNFVYGALALAMLLAAAPAISWAQDGFDFALVDDFEDGDLHSKKAGAWIAGTDRDDGGSSRGEVQAVDGGRSGKCLRYEYFRGEPFTHRKTGERTDPFVFLVLMADPVPFRPRDISAHKGIRFGIRKGGEYVAIVVSGEQKAPELFLRPFTVKGEDWQDVSLLFQDFSAIAGGGAPDMRTAMLVGMARIGGERAGSFCIDDFGMLDAASRPEAADRPEKIRFGQLTIRRPADWKWKEAKQLVWEEKCTWVSFFGLPMNGHRIYFSDGMSADPGNVRELKDCSVYEIQKFGLRNIKLLKDEKVRLADFSSHRFTFQAEGSEEIRRHMESLGMSGDRLFLQVDFVRHRSVTYEIVTAMPLEAVREVLPRVNEIIRSLERPR